MFCSILSLSYCTSHLCLNLCFLWQWKINVFLSHFIFILFVCLSPGCLLIVFVFVYLIVFIGSNPLIRALVFSTPDNKWMFLPPGSGGGGFRPKRFIILMVRPGPQPEKHNSGKGNISQGRTSITVRLPYPADQKKNLRWTVLHISLWNCDPRSILISQRGKREGMLPLEWFLCLCLCLCPCLCLYLCPCLCLCLC